MGGQQSKEEIVIAQAGNSGGQTSTNGKGLGIREVIEVIFILLFSIIMVATCYKTCMRRMEKKMRHEIAKSQDKLSS